MSRKYKDTRRSKTKKFWKDYYKDNSFSWNSQYTSDKACAAFVDKNKPVYSRIGELYTDFGAAPSWWTRLYMTKPSRRQEALAIIKILKDPEEADSFLFPLAKKPFVYYW